MDVTSAIAATVEARLRPTLERANQLRSALDSFVTAERAIVTARVTRDVLATLGQSAAAADDAAAMAQVAALERLRDAIRELLPPAAPTRRAATHAEKARAGDLRAELDRAEGAAASPGRLLLLMRAIAAESRLIMSGLLPGDLTYQALADLLDVMMKLRREKGITGFVIGLALTSTNDDWSGLAQDARERLKKFDKDAAEVRQLRLVARGGK